MPPFSPAESSWEEPPWSYDASLLYRRMALIEIDRNELAKDEPLLFRELQGLCALCPSKDRCAAELIEAIGEHSEGWREYCPNASALDVLGVEQNCGLAGQSGAGHERVVVTRLGSIVLRTPANKKMYLERKPGDPASGPRQYIYAASKGGVVPAR